VLYQWLERTAPDGYFDRMDLDPFRIMDGEYPEKVEDYTAIIVSGPAHGDFVEAEWIPKLVQFVRDVAEDHPGVKLIGLGLGHNIFAAAFGQNAEPRGWELGPYSVTLTEVGRSVFGRDSMVLQMLHQDHAFLPDLTERLRPIGGRPSAKSAPFHTWGYTANAPVQGLFRFSENYNPGSFCSPDELYANLRVVTCLARPGLSGEMMTEMIGELAVCNAVPGEAVDETGERWERGKDHDDDLDCVHSVWFGETIWEVMLANHLVRKVRVNWEPGQQRVYVF